MGFMTKYMQKLYANKPQKHLYYFNQQSSLTTFRSLSTDLDSSTQLHYV